MAVAVREYDALRDEALVYALWQGIGRLLLSHALDALKHRGVTKVQLGAGAYRISGPVYPPIRWVRGGSLQPVAGLL